MPRRHVPGTLQKLCIIKLVRNWDSICYGAHLTSQMNDLLETDGFLKYQGPFTDLRKLQKEFFDIFSHKLVIEMSNFVMRFVRLTAFFISSNCAKRLLVLSLHFTQSVNTSGDDTILMNHKFNFHMPANCWSLESLYKIRTCEKLHRIGKDFGRKSIV